MDGIGVKYEGRCKVVPCDFELGFIPGPGGFVVEGAEDGGKHKCCDRAEHKEQDEMLGVGREEILGCKERYCQRRSGKSSFGQMLVEKLLLGCASRDGT